MDREAIVINQKDAITLLKNIANEYKAHVERHGEPKEVFKNVETGKMEENSIFISVKLLKKTLEY